MSSESRRENQANFAATSPRFSDANLAKIRMEESEIKKLCEWLKNPKNMFIYLGNPGIGKTYTCAAIYYFMNSKVRNIRYYTERELLQKLRSHIESGSGGDYLNKLHYLSDDEFVILDDLGSSGVNDWRREVLFEFIDYRYVLKKPTVITSNLRKHEIKKEFGERIYSRMFAKENLILDVVGFDLREEGL